MLSVASVKSSSGAANYFAKDDHAATAEYYAGEKSSTHSEWGGKGAQDLGLSGEVTKEGLQRILDGVQPNGDAVGQVKNRQAGMDLTFSMPKSASILAYVAGDTRILAGHLTAVRNTMAYVEKFAEGRSYERMKNGEPVRTGNLVYAIFPHDTSRAADPQGHAHVIIANMTRMANGAWQALHNSSLWKNNSTFGAAYNAEFRAELQKLGYETTITGKHGQFEVNGVPEKVIQEFSQRRQDILAKAGELNISSTEGLREVAKRTRDPKIIVENGEELRSDWKARGASMGFDGQALVEEARERSGARSDARSDPSSMVSNVLDKLRNVVGSLTSRTDPLVAQGLDRLSLSPDELRAQHVTASAIRQLEQREAAFAITDITKAALNYGAQGVTVALVDERVRALVREEKLIPGASDRLDGHADLVTTPQGLRTETAILAGIERGRGSVDPIVSPEAATERLQMAAGDRPLNPGQLAAATLALASHDRTVAVQGVAGAGKSTMIASLARVAEAEGKQVIGLAFQNKMVTDLREGAGIEARTVSSFVNTYAKDALAGHGSAYATAREGLKDTILVLDESSMVASEPMRHLVGIANALGVDRLVMVGDRQQLSSIDAGKSFALAQAGGVGMARMDENLRQRTDQLRSVAALANRGQVAAAIEVLGDKMREDKDHVSAAADHWLGLSADDRDKTALFASGRAARATLNERVQDGLKAEGSLKGDGLQLTVLERVNLTREEMRYDRSYQPGQVLEVARSMPDIRLGVGRYDVIKVAGGTVTIRTDTGEKTFKPDKIDPKDKRDALGLSQRETLSLHEGDRIRWTQNDKERGLDNASLARVLSVANGGVTVETADKSVVELKPGDPMLERLGLAYALNMHMAQGVTADNGIAVMGSREQNLSNQRLFNVTVTRVRDDLTLYTDDKERLTAAIERNSGDKTSALETVGRIDIDRRGRPSGPSGDTQKPQDPETPKPGDPKSNASLDLRSMRVPDDIRTPDKGPQLPVPEKSLDLSL